MTGCVHIISQNAKEAITGLKEEDARKSWGERANKNKVHHFSFKGMCVYMCVREGV